jgi:hypothetical protein
MAHIVGNQATYRWVKPSLSFHAEIIPLEMLFGSPSQWVE